MRDVVGWLAGVNGVGRRSVGALVLAWAFACLAGRIGIPHVDPSLQPLARPLETVGSVALCLPASLHAALLHDRAAWMSAVSPRGVRRVRSIWLAIVAATSLPGLGVWLVTQPDDVAPGHVAALYLLLAALATTSITVLRPQLAVVLPFLAAVVFSVPGLVPFGANLVYNLSDTAALTVVAGVASLAAAGGFVLSGSRSA